MFSFMSRMMKPRRNNILILGLAILSLGLAAYHVDGRPDRQSHEDAMQLALNTEPPSTPPIDIATPSKFETASFGLG